MINGSAGAQSFCNGSKRRLCIYKAPASQWERPSGKNNQISSPPPPPQCNLFIRLRRMCVRSDHTRGRRAPAARVTPQSRPLAILARR